MGYIVHNSTPRTCKLERLPLADCLVKIEASHVSSKVQILALTKGEDGCKHSITWRCQINVELIGLYRVHESLNKAVEYELSETGSVEQSVDICRRLFAIRYIAILDARG